MKDYQAILSKALSEAYGEDKKFLFVYFTKTLQHAKGIVVTDDFEGLIEVIYNGDKDECYIATYDYLSNKVVKL